MTTRFPVFFLLITLLLLGAAHAESTHDPVRAAMSEGRFDAARGLLEGSGHGLAEAERFVLLTEVCTALEDYSAAIKYGKKAVAKLPQDSNAHYQYALAIRAKMQSVSVMKAMFSIGSYKKVLKKTRDLDPNNLDAREEEIGFLAHAPGVAGGDLEKVRALVEELQSIDPVRGRNMAIQVEAGKGDPERATALYLEALEDNPDDGWLRNRFGYHLQRQEQFKDADAQYEILQRSTDPRLARGAVYQRGRTRILGRFEQDQAIGFLTQYIESLPDDEEVFPTAASAYWRIGNAHEQLSRWTEARTAYTTTLKLEPDHEEAKKSLQELRR